MEGNSVTDSRSANYGAKPERTGGGSLQLSEEMQSLVLAAETGNSFTALLELPPNQARELLHAQGNVDAPAYRLLHPLNCTPTFPSNAALLERAAVFSVFAAENSQETSSIRGNSVGNSGEKVKQEPVDTDSNPNSSDLNGNQKSTKRKEREKKGKGLTKKSKSVANETSDDGEKLPYVHVRARRGQATDSHSLAERARREKINARMKLLQELVPGCNKISGTAMVLDEIINHVQSLQRQVERKTSFFKRPPLVPLLLITLLCSLSYSLGLWQNRRASRGGFTTTQLRCTRSPATNTTTLDFSSHHSAAAHGGAGTVPEGGVKTYPPCGAKYMEYTPCEDAKRSLKFKRDRLIYRERHCPVKGELLKCRVPAPHGYKAPFKWPKSRDLVWYANVPHKELTVEKAEQNWIRYEGDRFRFPGGGTMFPNGADAYIDDIGKLINLNDGSIRTAIDTGCGVASWGAYLLSRNILAVSFAPRDTHEAQVQFALERGVPALIGVLASKRLPYPSRAFDMAHCSRCLIPWGQYDGVYLMEVDRVLRPGGYWILSGPPIRWKKYWKGWQRTKEDLDGEQTSIENVAKSLCWKKLVEKGDIAIWQKPTNHLECKAHRKITQNPPFCPAQDPDKAWYTNIETCLTPLPEVSDNQEIAGGKLAKWPQRLNSIPPRISRGTVEGVTDEVFKQDNQLWKRRVAYYRTVNNQLGLTGRYRNLLDMNAYLGGFAAALVKDPVWVMNMVPAEAKINTLGVIYERGLIGTYQNWCEAMSTYPRTYDLIHSDSVFTLYKNRCEMNDILLEMDRILRPEGSVIIRDDVDILVKVKRITDGMNWDSRIVDHEDGPLNREKLLFAVKLYWTAPASS